MTDAQARLARLRRALLALLLFSLSGIAVELVLLEHFGDAWQFAPFVIVVVSLLSLMWHALRPGTTSLLSLRVAMVLSILSGVAGIYLHYRGNVEFELESSPAQGGFELFKNALMGATPALAPGTMTLLGVLGLLYAMTTEDSRDSAEPPRKTP